MRAAAAHPDPDAAAPDTAADTGRPSGWRIAGPALAAVLLGVVGVVVVNGALGRIWLLPVIALVQVVLLVWTAVAMRKDRGHHPLARTTGVVGIVVAALSVVAGVGLVVVLALVSAG